MEEKIIAIISAVLKLPLCEVKPGMNLWDDLGMREVDLMGATIELENEFSIKIDDDEFGRVRRVADVIDYVKRKVGNDKRTDIKEGD